MSTPKHAYIPSEFHSLDGVVREATDNLEHAVHVVHLQAVRRNVNELLDDTLTHFRVGNLHDLGRNPIRYLRVKTIRSKKRERTNNVPDSQNPSAAKDKEQSVNAGLCSLRIRYIIWLSIKHTSHPVI